MSKVPEISIRWKSTLPTSQSTPMDQQPGQCLYDGGAAAIVTTRPLENQNVTQEFASHGRKFTSSYEEEHAEVLTWIKENENYDYNRVLIYTDSQSLCIALTASNSLQTKTIQRLDLLIAEV